MSMQDNIKILDDGSVAVSLPLAAPISEAQCFPHLAALCVCEALGAKASIHWPCDVVLDGKKVCSVRCRAGEGVITPLLTLDVDSADRAALIEDIAARLSALAGGFPQNHEERLQDYCNRCVTLKKGVDAVYRGAPLNGYAFAVDRNGALMVMTESRTVVMLRSGPVKLAGPKQETMPDMPNPGRV